MSDLAAALDGLDPSGRQAGTTCRTGQILGLLTEAERASLIRVLGRKDIPATMISEVLSAKGHDVAASAISRHRRPRNAGGCTCDAATKG